METAINKLQIVPKGDTIEVCKENATFATAFPKYTLTQKLRAWFAVNITGTSKSLEEYLLMKNVKNALKLLNQNGLEKDLGITKEGVQRLIWLLGDVQNTKDGSGQFSSETISLVKNVLLKEVLLKQTTTLLDTSLSLTKRKLPPTSKQWRVSDYGIRIMEGHFVGSVIEATA